MPPICFPQVQRNAGTAETRGSHLFEKITTAACLMISKKALTKRGGKNLSPVVKYILKYFFLFSIEEMRSIFGKRGCIPALINSSRAALSVELPPEPCCTITQGGHLRSVWVWSRARVMNSCFFSLLPISTFIPQLIRQAHTVIFHLAAWSRLCICVYVCVFTCLAVNGRVLALILSQTPASAPPCWHWRLI